MLRSCILSIYTIYLGGNWRIIIKWILNKKVVSVHVYVWTGLNWLRMGPKGGFYEHCNGVSGFTKHELKNYETFKRFCSVSLLVMWLYLVAIRTGLTRGAIFKMETYFLYW
jgi:hypothetical protein